MDGETPFMNMFPDVYPKQATVNPATRPDLVGMLIKSAMLDDQRMLYRAKVIYGHDQPGVPDTVCFTVGPIFTVVGYDTELARDCAAAGQDSHVETWSAVHATWSASMLAPPHSITVWHQDIGRNVTAWVFPMGSIAKARTYLHVVRGALTFGDFNDRGMYAARDGNVPALTSDIMYGRLYFVSIDTVVSAAGQAALALQPHDLTYDRALSNATAAAFDTTYAEGFYKTACLDIETVFDTRYRDLALRCPHFEAQSYPYCTAGRRADMSRRRLKLADQAKIAQVRLPNVPPDMPGEQHEITSVSVVLINGNMPKPPPPKRRKTLVVFYNKSKVGAPPEASAELAASAGIDDLSRFIIVPCDSELVMLCRVLELLCNRVEILYVYNAGFDIRVIQQRVHFYGKVCPCRTLHGQKLRIRGERLAALWRDIFVSTVFASATQATLQFDNVLALDLYAAMLETAETSCHNPVRLREAITTYNRGKLKLGHFKVNGCGMAVVDLYRMAAERAVKFNCRDMKLNTVTPHIVAGDRALRGLPDKDPRKLAKLGDVAYAEMDALLCAGGLGLYRVLLYNLVDSQLCARLARAMRPVSAIFHQCRATLNIDVLVHGRSNTFGGFVQSITAVDMPQLKYRLDKLRAHSGVAGRKLPERAAWRMPFKRETEWMGGSVCSPLTGLHYSGPGMALELSFDFASMYPAIMLALNISQETMLPWPVSEFGHDLAGWVCYRWDAEGLPDYATLIMRFDAETGVFRRHRGTMAAAMERYLDQRTSFKALLADAITSGATNAKVEYYKAQEGVSKILANSFYGTAGPCGPVVASHGRHQIEMVNSCASAYFEHGCPVVYGDTDSVMVAVGPAPGEAFAPSLVDRFPVMDNVDSATEKKLMADLTARALETVSAKFEEASDCVPGFLNHTHNKLIDDVLGRMHLIVAGNATVRARRHPEGNLSASGKWSSYVVPVGGRAAVDITEAFVDRLRTKLEYENSASVMCHEAKKTYACLTHVYDRVTGNLTDVSVKVRGLAAFKSVRSASDTAMADAFIACVMRGDVVKLEAASTDCFSTTPWHRLAPGDSIALCDRPIDIDCDTGLWRDMDTPGEAINPHRVLANRVVDVGRGYSAALTTVQRHTAAKVGVAENTDTKAGAVTVVFTLHKDGKYCLNHLFSSAESVRRDLAACRAAELICSRTAAGFFPWSTLVKYTKIANLKPQTVARLRSDNAGVSLGYIETVAARLQAITKLTKAPVVVPGCHQVRPVDAAVHRYPLNLNARHGCLAGMFGARTLPVHTEMRRAEIIAKKEVAAGKKAAARANKQAAGQDVASDGPCSTKRACLMPDSDTSDASAEDMMNDGDIDDADMMDINETDSKNALGYDGWAIVSHPHLTNCTCYANSKPLISHLIDVSMTAPHAKMIAHCIVDYCVSRYMYATVPVAVVVDRCRQELLKRFESANRRLAAGEDLFLSLMNNCPPHMLPACEAEERDRIMHQRVSFERLTPHQRAKAHAVVVGDMGLNAAEAYWTAAENLRSALEATLCNNKLAFTTDEHAQLMTEPSRGGMAAVVTVTLPKAILRDMRVLTLSTDRLVVVSAEPDDSAVVNAAALLYQAVALKQIVAPDAFERATVTIDPARLCIAPLYGDDKDSVAGWLRAVAGKAWLKAKPRKGATMVYATGLVPDFHCIGCALFFKVLLREDVNAAELLKRVYTSEGRRRFGRCNAEPPLNAPEEPWLV